MFVQRPNAKLRRAPRCHDGRRATHEPIRLHKNRDVHARRFQPSMRVRALRTRETHVVAILYHSPTSQKFRPDNSLVPLSPLSNLVLNHA
jgi:hypothetical protein